MSRLEPQRRLSSMYFESITFRNESFVILEISMKAASKTLEKGGVGTPALKAKTLPETDYEYSMIYTTEISSVPSIW